LVRIKYLATASPLGTSMMPLLHGRLLELLGASTQLAICSKSPCSIAISSLPYLQDAISSSPPLQLSRKLVTTISKIYLREFMALCQLQVYSLDIIFFEVFPFDMFMCCVRKSRLVLKIINAFTWEGKHETKKQLKVALSSAS
jgi:hypothetical protein